MSGVGLSPKLAALLPQAGGRGASAAAGSGLSPQLAGLLGAPAQPTPAAPVAVPAHPWVRDVLGPAYTQVPSPHATRNALLVGPAETALHMLTGTGAQIAGGLAGLGDLAWTRNPGAAAQTVQRVENALTYEPRTRAGQMATHAAGYPFQLLGKGANIAGQKVADLTGSPLAGAAINTAIQAAPLAIGAKLPELRDAAPAPEVSPEVASARSVGIKLTPNQAQVPGGIIARTVESLAGHAKLERALSRANAEAVTEAAGRDIGVRGPVTRASIQAAKVAPNAVYGEVARLGTIPTDDAFRAQIAAIHNPGAGSFAFDVPPDIARLKEGYGALKNFDAADAVHQVRTLRKDSNANLGGPYDPARQALGRAQRSIADALEGQIDRHLQAVSAGRAPVAAERAPLAYDPNRAPLAPRNMVTPDATQDSILQFLAKHERGLSSVEGVAQGLDPADMGGSAARVGLKRAFRRGGMSFDQAAEALHQAGYPVADEAGRYDPNVLLNAVDSELRGKPVYSMANTRQAAELAHEAATAPASAAEPPDLTDLTSEAMKADPQRAQAILDGWSDDSPETIARVQRDLRAVADSAKPPPPHNDLIDRYRTARTQLAKINNVEQALRAGKGQAVSALNLAKQLDRGAPLTGNLRAIAEAAQHFPRAVQDLAKIRDSGPFSALDAKLETGLGVLHPVAALKAIPALAAQPLLRAVLGSDLYQDAAFGASGADSSPSALRLASRALPTTSMGFSAPHAPLAALLAGQGLPQQGLAALLARAHQ